MRGDGTLDERRTIQKRLGWGLVDFAVPYDYFAETIHLLPQGEEIIADKLLNFVIREMTE